MRCDALAFANTLVEGNRVTLQGEIKESCYRKDCDDDDGARRILRIRHFLSVTEIRSSTKATLILHRYATTT
ncbi:hypothetical protein ANO14919_053110 [Xylariales sp. No.14919]|nr:hypothetical protein ANO14919_053110 [Xylariales sp. No.14919]